MFQERKLLRRVARGKSIPQSEACEMEAAGLIELVDEDSPQPTTNESELHARSAQFTLTEKGKRMIRVTRTSA